MSAESKSSESNESARLGEVLSLHSDCMDPGCSGPLRGKSGSKGDNVPKYVADGSSAAAPREMSLAGFIHSLVMLRTMGNVVNREVVLMQ